MLIHAGSNHHLKIRPSALFSEKDSEETSVDGAEITFGTRSEGSLKLWEPSTL